MLELGLALCVALGGALGALGRWGIGELLAALRPPTPRLVPGEEGRAPGVAVTMPWGTFAANVLACFLFGVVMALLGSPTTTIGQLSFALLGTGICGALSTFSTMILDVVALVRRGATVSAVGYLLLTCGVGMAALWAGLAVAL
ncbi:CrcB family protein [Brachybacterium sp. EF45031]|uniref:fluoride efflux transporter FluC n=1 Tax=Brachybacterium sillae TaxID=2810536 RepID=UPI00217DB11A|nr:CrcB family protein [Brachybacterium sillae]MCS6712187.1 CrcB family protein [Brachybacterium sillae]